MNTQIPSAAPTQHRDESAENAARSHLTPAAQASLAVLRIAFGLTFLWAFLDKTFGLGYATASAKAWIHGGSPTRGFLSMGSHGPFKGFYGSIAGDAWVDVAFMVALLCLGVALTLGIGTRLAGFGGAVLYLLMWSVYLPPVTNPVIDEHILGALTLMALALVGAGRMWGLDRWWRETTLAQKYPLLR